ncbi:Ferredoxin-dependent glutamate synthase [Actinidia chinensis var. chinensis]|uniref:Ferredoxin-dependent glutamate synthase n=1 Tax=Actinidia chinensis var. chinensis TaxID=1590841 RepID=A0A2R6RY10_ACTCC|nr:Ferredoxin-dependent glutamate synthase [Actinidia chinensis var. chinensis]
MGGETVTESWFSSLWRTSRKSIVSESEKAVIGILTFEVASLMSKVVNLWQCLGDRQIVRLREEIVNSLGIRKLVSDDDDYLMDLALAEIIENLGCLVESVARFGKRCTDPVYHCLEHVFDDPIETDLNWCGWEYKLKKMEKKVKKMERFVAVTAQLFQELEVLAELEQSLKRMQGRVDLGQVKLLEFQQKVMWQRQEVKNLREMSPWVRTYDYTVRLLLRSLFTIVERIKHVFGVNQLASVEENNDSEHMDADCLVHSHSISARMHTSVRPSETNLSRFHSGPLGRSVSNLGMTSDKSRSKKQCQAHYQSLTFLGKPALSSKTRGLAHVGPFKGCMTGGSESPVLLSCTLTSSGPLRSTDAFSNNIDKPNDRNKMSLSCNSLTRSKVSLFISKHKLLNAPPTSLGAAALALHYANVIILIEKLASSPHLISLDARDDLYNMLPTSVRASMREKLKLFAKTSTSSIYDSALATDWSLALARILEWLSPLAHNMIRWHSERNYEKQRMAPGTNMLLVQTLHFANQVKTEAAIIELLMGLNYISKFGREIDERAFMESAGRSACVDNFLQRDNIIYGM